MEKNNNFIGSFSGFIPQEEVFEGLREASTLADPQARPYKDADFSIQEIEIADIKPTQLYEIAEHTSRVEKIRNYILSLNQDILRMTFGGVEFSTVNGSEILLPPIVENNSEEGLMLLDGTHRSFLAKKLGMKTMNFLLVDNIAEQFSLTQRRLPNNWDEITTFETLQDLKTARRNGFIHRREGRGENQDNSYRDFSHLTGRGKDERK